MRLLGARVAEAGEGYCTIEVPFSGVVTQQERYFHGAVIGAVGDNAGGYATLTLAPPDREVLTVEYKVNFLAPAFGERLVARGGGVAARRRLFVCQAAVLAGDGGGRGVCAPGRQTGLLSPLGPPDPRGPPRRPPGGV